MAGLSDEDLKRALLDASAQVPLRDRGQEIVRRGGIAPLVEYEGGRTELGLPSAIKDQIDFTRDVFRGGYDDFMSPREISPERYKQAAGGALAAGTAIGGPGALAGMARGEAKAPGLSTVNMTGWHGSPKTDITKFRTTNPRRGWSEPAYFSVEDASTSPQRAKQYAQGYMGDEGGKLYEVDLPDNLIDARTAEGR